MKLQSGDLAAARRGNTATITRTSWSRRSCGRPTRAVYGTGDTLLEQVEYKYDAWGNLVERDDTRRQLADGDALRRRTAGTPRWQAQTGLANFNVWADLDAGNDLLTRYFHGDQVDQLFARQDSLPRSQYWYMTDRQGSVRDVLDNSGNVKDAITYDGFGNIISETDSTYRGNYAWTGRQFDVETDLQYNRARWYDPTTGRWQSQDPLGFDAGDSNLYRYVRNAPPQAVDPSGLDHTLLAVAIAKPAGFILGSFIWPIQWRIKPKAGPIGGYILQHLDITFDVKDKNGQKLTHPSDTGHDSYWEAWRIDKNQTTSQSGGIPDFLEAGIRGKLKEFYDDANGQNKTYLAGVLKAFNKLMKAGAKKA